MTENRHFFLPKEKNFGYGIAMSVTPGIDDICLGIRPEDGHGSIINLNETDWETFKAEGDKLFAKGKRLALEEDYPLGEGDLIEAPGKFEGEPLWAPYFWEQDADEDDGEGVYTYHVTEKDRAIFPELKAIKTVFLEEDDQGFVTSDYEEVDAEAETTA